VVNAAVDVLVAGMRRYDAYLTAGSAAPRLGTEWAQPVATPPIAGLDVAEEIATAVQNEASRRNTEQRVASRRVEALLLENADGAVRARARSLERRH
jgi:hypothetical protein